MSLFSIGVSCLPKFGIDEFACTTHTYFYDWLITDLTSLEKSLTDFQEEKFLNSGTEICDNGLGVKDNHTGLRFQHDFPSTPEGKIIPELISDNINCVKEKYLRRRARFFKSVSEDDFPIFTRYEWGGINHNDLKRIQQALTSAFSRNFKLIILSSRVEKQASHGSADIFPVTQLADTPWKASAASWNAILDHCKRNYGISSIEGACQHKRL